MSTTVSGTTTSTSGTAATITVPADNNTTVNFTNTYSKYFNPGSDQVYGDYFFINKTGDDKPDAKLAGAVFALYQYDEEAEDHKGAEVWRRTSTDYLSLIVNIYENGISNPKDVSQSRTYILEEVSAPANYGVSGPWLVTLEGTRTESDSTNSTTGQFYYTYTWTVKSVKLVGGTDELYDAETKTISVVDPRDRGELTIEKKLAGDNSTEASGKTFTFDITGPSDVNGTFDGVKFEGGKATVSIKGAGSQKITGLPTGSYTVKENTTDIQISYMDLTVSYLDSDKDPSDTEKANTTDGIVTVLKGEESTMTVTNTYTYEDDDDDDDDEPEIITDPDVPTTDVPVIPVDPAEPEEPPVEIPEEEPPLAEAPETGDATIAWILAAAVSGIGLVWLAISGKKRKDESAE